MRHGRLELVFLGTAASIPTRERGLPSIAVRMGHGVVLMDCGEGTQRQLGAAGVSFMRIELILVSHFHGDHFLGIPGLLQTMTLNGRTAPLRIAGPAGMAELGAGMLGLGYFKPSFPIEFLELSGGQSVQGRDFTVSSMQARHSVPALSYRIREPDRPGRFNRRRALELGVPEGRMFGLLQRGESVQIDGRTVGPGDVMGPARSGLSIVYSGDTAACDEMVVFARGANVLVHDSTYGSDMQDKAAEFGHATSAQAAAIAKAAGVELLVLFHISSRHESDEVLLREAREIFPNTLAASDMLSLPVLAGKGPA